MNYHKNQITPQVYVTSLQNYPWISTKVPKNIIVMGYVHSHRTTLQLDKTLFELPPKVFFFIPPESFVSFPEKVSRELDCSLIIINPAWLLETLDFERIPSQPIHVFYLDEQKRKPIDDYFSGVSDPYFQTQLKPHSIFLDYIFSHLLEIHVNSIKQNSGSYPEEVFHSARNYIENHSMEEKIFIPMLSHFGIANKSFFHSYEAYFSCSAYDHLQQERFHQAQYLLEAGHTYDTVTSYCLLYSKQHLISNFSRYTNKAIHEYPEALSGNT